jgi:hypothetical protein
MTNATSTQLQELYVAYFGRAADPTGLDYWTESGITTAKFAADMYAQAEFKDAYGSLSTESQVNQIYKNLFDREADVTGLSYWTKEINLGNLQLAEIATHLIWAAQNNEGSSDDKTALANRTSAAIAYTAEVGATTAGRLAYKPINDGLAAGSTYSAGSNILEAKSFMSGIDKDTAHTASGVTTSVGVITATGPASETATAVTKTFTSNLDALVGTSAADTFDGVYYADGGTGTTAFPGDSAKGEGGIDTFNLSVAGKSTAAQAVNAITTTSVEKLLVTNYDTNTNEAHDTTIDTSLMSGLTTIGLTGSNDTGDTEFTNVDSIVTTEFRNGSGDLKITYLAAAVEGAADSASLTVSNLTSGNTGFTSNGIETLNIKSELSKSTINSVVSDTLTKLVVTGDQNLTISTAVDFVDGTNGDTTIDSTIDASAFTGDLTVTAEAMDQSITGGSGSDTINTVATLDKNDTIDGGAGRDILTADAATWDEQFTNVSNVEIVSINAATAATATAADKLSAGVDTIILDNSDAADGEDELEHTVTGEAGQKIVLRHSAEDDPDANDSDGANYTITNKTDTGADSITVEFEGVGVDTHTATTYYGIDGLTVNNYETVNLISSVNTVATTGTGQAAAVGAVKVNELDALSASSATSIIVTGDAELQIGSVTATSASALETFDASALNAKLTYVADGSKGTYKAALKDTVFTFGSNLTNADTVIGGPSAKDSLGATISGLVATTGDLKISDIETIDFTTGGDNVIDASGITGTTVIAVTDNKQTFTNFDLVNQTIQLGIGTDGSATSSEIDVTPADATGTADVLNVQIQDFGETGAATTTIIDAPDTIETLSIVENVAANAVTIDMSTFEGANIILASATGITRTAKTDFGALHKNARTLTSTSKDKVDADFSLSTSPVTVSGLGTDVQDYDGGTKGDTFTIGTTGNITHLVDGNGGTDTTNITVNGDFVNVGSIDTENINITQVAGTSSTLSGATFGAGVDNVTLTAGNSLSTFTSNVLADTIKTFDASAYLGNIVVDVEANDLDSTIVITAASLTTDELEYNITIAGTDYLYSTGVEILDLDVDQSSTLDISNSTGVTTIDVDVSANDTFVIDKLLGTERIDLTAAGSAGIVEMKLANDEGTSDSLSIKLTGGGTIDDAGGLKTTDIETLNIEVDQAETITLADLGAITAASTYSTLKLTGDSVLTASATNADITTIDASGMSDGGAFVQSARSATTAVTYTGSDGNDTFIMSQSADVIDGGSGTGDTLDVDFNGILGGIGIDLSVAAGTDQLTSFNGLANSQIQANFENVDLSGYSSSGAQVTGSKAANTITVSEQTDVINAGAGDDTIKGTLAGLVTDADVITFGDGTDTLQFTSTGDHDVSGWTAHTDAPEVYVTAADAGADTYRFAHADLVAAATLTITSGADGHQDVFYLEKLTTNFEASAETATGDVDTAGEWMLVNSHATDGVIHYYNESLLSCSPS